jgi:hypothetical protein
MSKTMDDKLLLLEPKTILSNVDISDNVTITEPEIKLETYQHVEPDKDSVIKVSLVVTCCPKEDCEKCKSCESCESCETCEGCLCEKDCQCNSCEKKQKELNSCSNIIFMKWFSFLCCKSEKKTDDVLPSDKIETEVPVNINTDIIPETQPDK